MIEAVLFDMDGVIIDSEPLHKESFFIMAERLKIDMSTEEYEQFIGRSSINQWQYAVENYGLAHPPATLALEQIKIFLEQLDVPGKAQRSPGLDAILKCIASRNLTCGVASSNNRSAVDKVLSLLELNNHFQVVVTANDTAKAKPAPDLFLLASEKIGVPPEKCLVIEDAYNGVTAAKAAGMSCVGYRNPNSGKQDLSAADYWVDRLEQVVEILELEERA
ncbi:MAG: HAD family hydrolase [Desulfovibrio sp.]|uniref:HAD family hydrolase n=1 Tax=Desulfovibrio sp. 7SRBS1 TaxID=3378064 RepID=UPI003B3F0B24